MAGLAALLDKLLRDAHDRGARRANRARDEVGERRRQRALAKEAFDGLERRELHRTRGRRQQHLRDEPAAERARIIQHLDIHGLLASAHDVDRVEERLGDDTGLRGAARGCA